MEDRRRHSRLDRQCRLEYGPFSPIMQPDRLRPGLLLNLSDGGALLQAHEEYAVGAQLFLKLSIAGWKQKGRGCAQTFEKEAELLLTTVAEVLHVAADGAGGFRTGVRFLGRVRL